MMALNIIIDVRSDQHLEHSQGREIGTDSFSHEVSFWSGEFSGVDFNPFRRGKCSGFSQYE
jgi:hypothetical protein